MISNAMKKVLMTLAAAPLALGLSASCSSDSDDSTVVTPAEKTYDMTGFAKGADVSWLTEMESENVKFYNRSGSEQECMSLLRDLGFNSIRLRVWVNPGDDVGGWCDKEDMLVKAKRASSLGMRIMVDFHYSDTWADPGQQDIPAAWADYDLEQMKTAVADHTKEVLNLLKTNGIDVEWVQVGNETTTGMLWPMGKVSEENGHGNFAALFSSGYDAVKSVYPNAKVIVHIDRGHEIERTTYICDGLAANNAKWDVIGLSLYPDVDKSTNESPNWKTEATQMLENIDTLIAKYNCEVMIAEVGMNWDDPNLGSFLSTVITGGKAIDGCLGVFYWEPQAYNWKDYSKGAFNTQGTPMKGLDAFGN